MGLASIRTKRTGMLKMASAVTGKNSQSIYFRLLICNIYTKPWWSMNFEILIMMLLWPLWTRWLCSNDAMSLRVELITRFRFTRRPGHIVGRLHSVMQWRWWTMFLFVWGATHNRAHIYRNDSPCCRTRARAVDDTEHITTLHFASAGRQKGG